MKRTHYNPRPGIFDIQDFFLTNIRTGYEEPPVDEGWFYILWGRFKSNRRQVLIVLTGDTEEEVNNKLRGLAEKAEIYN